MTEDVRGLLAEAGALYRDSPRASVLLREALGHLDEPLRVGITGAPGTGKSTLAAALGDTRSLRDLALVDDPAASVLTDATVRLLRHLEPDELAGAHPAARSAFARQTAVDTVLVLARADETGAGRIDALLTAKQLARRAWREDPLCSGAQGVIAVAAQLAYGARAFTEDEFELLAAFAAVPREELERYVLSVDAFTDPAFPGPVSVDTRRSLVSRFGLFGVKLALTLIRTGSDSRVKLSTELVRRSGLGELRDTVAGCFAARAEALKARTAVVRLETVLQSEPRPHSDRLQARVERFAATAHDFTELRLIADIRGGRTALSGEPADEAVRLLGAQGTTPEERLGLDFEADPREVYAAGADAVLRWRHEAERQDRPPAERAAAHVVVRSAEGVLALFA
ncbi:GTPase [Amycolatopsis rhabdoformis]|uniref:GTPase n=1 Tax=Amycolatopsis rhabdoformis TaxID=1448059 RepID=A0ABZ1I6N7_9PSEU|nr:GTPase [Amycolatopsis rhabdoformis]WSE30007.1 GTPase [Amycolatopsis rhabdoformis]